MPDEEKEVLRKEGNPALDQDGDPLVQESGSSSRAGRGDPAVDRDGGPQEKGSGSSSRIQRVGQGAPFLPCIAHVRVQWVGSKGVEVSRLSSSNESSVELERVVQQEFNRRPAFELESKFDLCSCNIVISKGFSGRTQSDPVDAISSSLEKAVDDFRDHRLDAEIQNAHAHGKWSVSFQGFDLTFVSCHHQSVDIRQQYKEAQKAREEIDAQRDEWLHLQAEPLLVAMEEQLRDSSLPSNFREDIQAMRQRLRMDAYNYSQLVDSSSAAEITNLSERSVERYANSGDLGIMFRDAVVSREEAKAFGGKTRKKTGRPPKE